MPKLTDLKNIGPAMEGWLKAADIHTPEALEELGAVEAYTRIKPHMPCPNLMAMYALYGAIHDVNCLKLDEEVKDMLKGMLAE